MRKLFSKENITILCIVLFSVGSVNYFTGNLLNWLNGEILFTILGCLVTLLLIDKFRK